METYVFETKESGVANKVGLIIGVRRTAVRICVPMQRFLVSVTGVAGLVAISGTPMLIETMVLCSITAIVAATGITMMAQQARETVVVSTAVGTGKETLICEYSLHYPLWA